MFITVFVLGASLCTNAYPITDAYSVTYYPPQSPPTPMLQSRNLYGQKWILDTYDKTLQDEDKTSAPESPTTASTTAPCSSFPVRNTTWVIPTAIPVIIMKKKSGQVLSGTGVYRKASGREKKRMEGEAVGKMCEKVAEFAERKQILRLDNKEQNALVTLSGKTVTSVELVDMGPPGIFSVSKDAKREDIIRNQYLCTGTVNIKDGVITPKSTGAEVGGVMIAREVEYCGDKYGQK
ncbi:hypothetical protein C8R41DRAFT_868786 [Lentinula lateritia]|uniref:Uncharacterized protein n=1 Tax=Lentinula lateritia TaxID=40482 RepID=A0ABQ8VBC7_9AGAR|nr:hypothetical protein C8R41DRAFT_868786 [Lentinula lateritia]